MEAERAQTTQMDVMPHDPLDRQQRELPVVFRSDKRAPGLIAMRQRAAVDPAHHPLQPAPFGIVVDRLGMDPEALLPIALPIGMDALAGTTMDARLSRAR